MPPESVDLRAQLGPVRDQGLRPTCLAFATTAAHEHARTAGEVLSVEALFARAKQRDGLGPTAGTTVPAITDALAREGQCPEAEWPYGSPMPTKGARFYRARADHRGGDLVKQMCFALASGRTVVLVTRITAAWHRVGADGLVRSLPADPLAYHAVLAVGYDAAGQKLLIRNSWGTTWGMRGCAWLPFSHVATNARAAFVVIGETGPGSR